MKAQVELVHRDRGMYGAQIYPDDETPSGQYAVFEIFDLYCEPDAGDWLRAADFYSPGNRVWLDETKGRSIELVAKGAYNLGGAKSACLL